MIKKKFNFYLYFSSFFVLCALTQAWSADGHKSDDSTKNVKILGLDENLSQELREREDLVDQRENNNPYRRGNEVINLGYSRETGDHQPVSEFKKSIDNLAIEQAFLNDRSQKAYGHKNEINNSETMLQAYKRFLVERLNEEGKTQLTRRESTAEEIDNDGRLAYVLAVIKGTKGLEAENDEHEKITAKNARAEIKKTLEAALTNENVQNSLLWEICLLATSPQYKRDVNAIKDFFKAVLTNEFIESLVGKEKAISLAALSRLNGAFKDIIINQPQESSDKETFWDGSASSYQIEKKQGIKKTKEPFFNVLENKMNEAFTIKTAVLPHSPWDLYEVFEKETPDNKQMILRAFLETAFGEKGVASGDVWIARALAQALRVNLVVESSDKRDDFASSPLSEPIEFEGQPVRIRREQKNISLIMHQSAVINTFKNIKPGGITVEDIKDEDINPKTLEYLKTLDKAQSLPQEREELKKLGYKRLGKGENIRGSAVERYLVPEDVIRNKRENLHKLEKTLQETKIKLIEETKKYNELDSTDKAIMKNDFQNTFEKIQKEIFGLDELINREHAFLDRAQAERKSLDKARAYANEQERLTVNYEENKELDSNEKNKAIEIYRQDLERDYKKGLTGEQKDLILAQVVNEYASFLRVKYPEISTAENSLSCLNFVYFLDPNKSLTAFMKAFIYDGEDRTSRSNISKVIENNMREALKTPEGCLAWLSQALNEFSKEVYVGTHSQKNPDVLFKTTAIFLKQCLRELFIAKSAAEERMIKVLYKGHSGGFCPKTGELWEWLVDFDGKHPETEVKRYIYALFRNLDSNVLNHLVSLYEEQESLQPEEYYLLPLSRISNRKNWNLEFWNNLINKKQEADYAISQDPSNKLKKEFKLANQHVKVMHDFLNFERSSYFSEKHLEKNSEFSLLGFNESEIIFIPRPIGFREDLFKKINPNTSNERFDSNLQKDQLPEKVFFNGVLVGNKIGSKGTENKDAIIKRIKNEAKMNPVPTDLELDARVLARVSQLKKDYRSQLEKEITDPVEGILSKEKGYINASVPVKKKLLKAKKAAALLENSEEISKKMSDNFYSEKVKTFSQEIREEEKDKPLSEEEIEVRCEEAIKEAYLDIVDSSSVRNTPDVWKRYLLQNLQRLPSGTHSSALSLVPFSEEDPEKDFLSSLNLANNPQKIKQILSNSTISLVPMLFKGSLESFPHFSRNLSRGGKGGNILDTALLVEKNINKKDPFVKNLNIEQQTMLRKLKRSFFESWSRAQLSNLPHYLQEVVEFFRHNRPEVSNNSSIEAFKIASDFANDCLIAVTKFTQAHYPSTPFGNSAPLVVDEDYSQLMSQEAISDLSKAKNLFEVIRILGEEGQKIVLFRDEKGEETKILSDKKNLTDFLDSIYEKGKMRNLPSSFVGMFENCQSLENAMTSKDLQIFENLLMNNPMGLNKWCLDMIEAFSGFFGFNTMGDLSFYNAEGEGNFLVQLSSLDPASVMEDIIENNEQFKSTMDDKFIESLSELINGLTKEENEFGEQFPLVAAHDYKLEIKPIYSNVEKKQGLIETFPNTICKYLKKLGIDFDKLGLNDQINKLITINLKGGGNLLSNISERLDKNKESLLIEKEKRILAMSVYNRFRRLNLVDISAQIKKSSNLQYLATFFEEQKSGNGQEKTIENLQKAYEAIDRFFQEEKTKDKLIEDCAYLSPTFCVKYGSVDTGEFVKSSESKYKTDQDTLRNLRKDNIALKGSFQTAQAQLRAEEIKLEKDPKLSSEQITKIRKTINDLDLNIKTQENKIKVGEAKLSAIRETLIGQLITYLDEIVKVINDEYRRMKKVEILLTRCFGYDNKNTLEKSFVNGKPQDNSDAKARLRIASALKNSYGFIKNGVDEDGWDSRKELLFPEYKNKKFSDLMGILNNASDEKHAFNGKKLLRELLNCPEMKLKSEQIDTKSPSFETIFKGICAAIEEREAGTLVQCFSEDLEERGDESSRINNLSTPQYRAQAILELTERFIIPQSPLRNLISEISGYFFSQKFMQPEDFSLEEFDRRSLVSVGTEAPEITILDEEDEDGVTVNKQAPILVGELPKASADIQRKLDKVINLITEDKTKASFSPLDLRKMDDNKKELEEQLKREKEKEDAAECVIMGPRYKKVQEYLNKLGDSLSDAKGVYNDMVTWAKEKKFDLGDVVKDANRFKTVSEIRESIKKLVYEEYIYPTLNIGYVTELMSKTLNPSGLVSDEECQDLAQMCQDILDLKNEEVSLVSVIDQLKKTKDFAFLKTYLRGYVALSQFVALLDMDVVIEKSYKDIQELFELMISYKNYVTNESTGNNGIDATSLDSWSKYIEDSPLFKEFGNNLASLKRKIRQNLEAKFNKDKGTARLYDPKAALEELYQKNNIMSKLMYNFEAISEFNRKKTKSNNEKSVYLYLFDKTFDNDGEGYVWDAMAKQVAILLGVPLIDDNGHYVPLKKDGSLNLSSGGGWGTDKIIQVMRSWLGAKIEQNIDQEKEVIPSYHKDADTVLADLVEASVKNLDDLFKATLRANAFDKPVHDMLKLAVDKVENDEAFATLMPVLQHLMGKMLPILRQANKYDQETLSQMLRNQRSTKRIDTQWLDTMREKFYVQTDADLKEAVKDSEGKLSMDVAKMTDFVEALNNKKNIIQMILDNRFSSNKFDRKKWDEEKGLRNYLSQPLLLDCNVVKKNDGHGADIYNEVLVNNLFLSDILRYLDKIKREENIDPRSVQDIEEYKECLENIKNSGHVQIAFNKENKKEFDSDFFK